LNREFLRREWGAVSFLIVTALGIVVVPIGLNLNKQSGADRRDHAGDGSVS